MRFYKLVLLVLLLSFIPAVGCRDLKARRNLPQAVKISMSRITLLQSTMCSEAEFDLTPLNQIFHRDALVNILPPVEEKMRSFYGITPNIEISLLGELLKVACPEFISLDLDKNCYFVRKVAKRMDFEYIEGILITLEGDFSGKFIFFRTDMIDGKINIENTTCNSTPLVQCLSILPSGKISNPEYEKIVLSKLNKHSYRKISHWQDAEKKSSEPNGGIRHVIE